MDSDSIFTIIAMVALLIASGFFSATETAYSSLNKLRIKNLADKNDKSAVVAYKLIEKYDQVLSTVLIGNNIVNISLASVGTVFFVDLFKSNPAVSGATVSTVVITVIVLIFGEITPKSLAKDSPEKFAIHTASFVNFLVIIFTPLNFLFSLWKKLISKIVNVSDDYTKTEDELMSWLEEAENDGGIDKQESELLKSAVEFNNLEAIDILTPRVDVVAVPSDATEEEINTAFYESGYTRLPVYKDTIDNIIGIIHQKDFFTLKGKKSSVKDLMKKPLFIPPNVKIDNLLKLLQTEKCHLAVVTDEYGGTMGIVTMEDILEELVGEIWDEHDEVIDSFKELPNGKTRVNCNTDLGDFFEHFGIPNDAEDEYDSATVSGWVMEQLSRIPEEGESFNFKNLAVTVTKIDDRRVVEIEVGILELPDDEAEKDKEKSKED